MTPKEKAEKMVGGFCKITCIGMGEFAPLILVEQAKQCAIICCDEIIKSHHELRIQQPITYSDYMKYWQEVKEQIENL